MKAKLLCLALGVLFIAAAMAPIFGTTEANDQHEHYPVKEYQNSISIIEAPSLDLETTLVQENEKIETVQIHEEVGDMKGTVRDTAGSFTLNYAQGETNDYTHTHFSDDSYHSAEEMDGGYAGGGGPPSHKTLQMTYDIPITASTSAPYDLYIEAYDDDSEAFYVSYTIDGAGGETQVITITNTESIQSYTLSGVNPGDTVNVEITQPDKGNGEARGRVYIDHLYIESTETSNFNLQNIGTLSSANGGWNFISFNVIADGDNYAQSDDLIEILEDTEYGISGSYDKCLFFDASADGWKTYMVGRSVHYNSLSTWDNTRGLWIHMTVDDELSVEGTIPADTDITLYPGWNMVSYPSNTPGNSNIPAEVTKIGYMDRAQAYDITYDHDPQNYEFTPCEGYWVYNGADYSVLWSGTNDITAPTVSSTSPTDGATGVSVSTNIVITFSEEMDQASVESALAVSPSFTYTSSWNAAGDQLTLTPDSNLDSTTTYTVDVSTDAQDIVGNNMESLYSFSFTTEDNVPPTVTSTSPTDGSTSVSISTTIDITFSEEMDQASTENAFSIENGVTGTLSWNAAGTTMTFTPDSDLSFSTTYTVTVDGTAMDLAGNTLDGDGDGTSEGSPQDDYSFSFTTSSNSPPDAPFNPVPSNGATGVGTSPTLSVDVTDPDGDTMDVYFYDASDDSLIGTDTTVNSGGTASVTWSGLSEGTTYDWYAIADDGLSSTQSTTWSFTTQSGGDPVEYYAVLVGISDYEYISDLSYCDEDVTDIYNWLEGQWSSAGYTYTIEVYGDGHTNDYPIYTDDAYEVNVKAALDTMYSNADSNDVTVYTTSGHGDGDGSGSSYLCQLACGSGYGGEDGDYYDTELDDSVATSTADTNFVFIDHCYSGGMGPELMSLGNSANTYCTTTCTEDGYGWDDGTHNNGAWTYQYFEWGWVEGNGPDDCEGNFVAAHDAYPHSGGDEPQEFDGDGGKTTYLW